MIYILPFSAVLPFSHYQVFLFNMSLATNIDLSSLPGLASGSTTNADNPFVRIF